MCLALDDRAVDGRKNGRAAAKIAAPPRVGGVGRLNDRRPFSFSYGTTELTDVPQFVLPFLVPPHVPSVRVNAGGSQFGYSM